MQDTKEHFMNSKTLSRMAAAARHDLQQLRSPFKAEAMRAATETGLVCLFDGTIKRDLTRHLRAMYGMTPEAYRTAHGLPGDCPVAVQPKAGTVAAYWNR